MKRVLRLILRIFLLMALLIALLYVGLMFAMSTMKSPEPPANRRTACDPGPLKTVETCKSDHAVFSWLNSGWRYSDAIGDIQYGYRETLEIKPASISNNGGAVSPISCELVLDKVADNQICYGSQNFSNKANTRYFTLLILEKDSNKARFFEGSQYLLLKGKPTEVGRDVYPGIPEGAVYDLVPIGDSE